MSRADAPPIFVSIRIHASIDRVWELTQDPRLHSRWDARFSEITPIEGLPGGGMRFRYQRRLPGGHTITGTGTTIGERSRTDGTRTSALRFDTPDPLSPLGAGRGYWRYRQDGDSVVFSTGYDYEPAWGQRIDAVSVRPLVGWITAWSFDRLRIWAEHDIAPERWSLTSMLRFWRPERPQASRCDRRPPLRRVMDAAPATLRELVAP